MPQAKKVRSMRGNLLPTEGKVRVRVGKARVRGSQQHTPFHKKHRV